MPPKRSHAALRKGAMQPGSPPKDDQMELVKKLLESAQAHGMDWVLEKLAEPVMEPHKGAYTKRVRRGPACFRGQSPRWSLSQLG